MAIIPKEPEIPENNLLGIIDSETFENPNRDYMGYSESGDSCKRRIWYNFHWCHTEIITARTQRIFDTGHIFETFVIDALTKAGFPITHRQLEVVGCYGHVKGHIDGFVWNINFAGSKMLLEVKTSNDKGFKEILKHKVKRAKPEHYSQMQAYMGKLKIENCLYVCYNKNDSSFYFEIVPYNHTVFLNIESMWFDVLTSEFPPNRIGDKTWYECKMCSKFGICHKNEPIALNCRTCEHVLIEDEGVWACGLSNSELSIEAQRKGCMGYELNKNLTNGE